jgi:hypothetical protein
VGRIGDTNVTTMLADYTNLLAIVNQTPDGYDTFASNNA